ncbi:MAG: hypothetical protein C5B52_02025 [Bacteroidetes bacterium]|nr:MAG: hypothetical protein C5B52_02025 [Bacteroidota bacterium]
MAQPKLEKNIGLWSATTIVIGSVIGSVIFMKPATMAGQLGSPQLLLAVWAIAGVISIFGAMSFAELGTMFPETGGQFIYLQKAYGDFIAYMYGWSSIAVINTAAIASMAFVCASYAGYIIHIPRFDTPTELSLSIHIPMIGNIFPLENFGVKTLAIGIIMGLTFVNYLSVRSGNAIQFLATVLKTVAIILLVFGILFSGKGSVSNFTTNAPDFHLSGFALFAAFMAATTGAFASYDGWNNLNMVAGEIVNPQKNITKSLIWGLLICIAVYVLMNLAFVYALPIGDMSKSSLVASDTISKVLGNTSGAVVAILIVISAFGATNVNLLTNARVVFAMAETKNFFSWAGKVHQKNKTPGNAVIILGIWSSILVLSGSFDVLADMFIFMSWIFYALVICAVFIFRRKLPNAPRPYKVKWYPWLPIIFVLFTAFYIFTTLYTDITNYITGKSPIINSVFGIILTLAGAPLYWYFRRANRNLKDDEALVAD